MVRYYSKSLRGMTVAVVLGVLAGCGSAEERAVTYYQSGVEYLEKQEFTKAAVEFRNALKLNENYADAWYGMAKIEEQQQNWQRVYGDLVKVLEIDPKHVRALTDLAKLKLLSGDDPGAMKDIDAAMAVEPDNADIMAVKAAILLKRKDQEGALREANRALEKVPNHPDAASVVASDFLLKGDAPSAMAVVESALSLAPKNLGLNLMRFRIAEQVKDLPKQEESIRQMIVEFPENKDFRKVLLSFLTRNGRAADAEAELRSIIAAEPDNTEAGLDLVRYIGGTRSAKDARAELVALIASSKAPFAYQLALADFDFSAGRRDEAIADLRKLAADLGITDNGIEARQRLVDRLLSTKQFADAKKYIEEVLTNDTQNVTALRQRGALLIEQGNTEEAIKDLRAALDLDAKDPGIRVLLGSAYQRSGSIELAGKELVEAMRLSEYEPRIALIYARFLLQHGGEERAVAVLEEVVARSPKDKNVLSLLGSLRLKNGDWKGAEEVARKLKEEAGEDAMADRFLSDSLMGQKRFEDAAALLQKRADAEPVSGQPMAALVRAHLAANKAEEAETYLKAVLEKEPDNAEALVLMGGVQQSLGKPELAFANYEMAVAKSPADPIGYMAMSRHYARQKDAGAAMKILAEGIEKVTDNTNLRVSLAGYYEATGKIEEAISQYDLVLGANPGVIIAVNNLASLLTDNRTDAASLERAAALAAVLRDSPVPQFRETLGWALVQKGDVRSGLPILERAISELPNVPVAQYHLGVAYSLAGDKNMAAKHLRLALEMEKNPELQAKIKEQLGKAETAQP